MTTHVALAASSWRDYSYSAVFGALLWRDRVGFHPIVLRVGDWQAQERTKIALEALDHWGIDHVQVPMDGIYEEATYAQNCRQHLGCLDLPDEDWAMPSDADLWPLRSSYYHVDRPTSLYANGDHGSTLPTCHVVLKVSEWRRLYECKAGDPIGPKVRTLLDHWIVSYRQRWPWTDRNFALWLSDQAVMTEKVLAGVPDLVRVDRVGHPPVDRLDRGNWPSGDWRVEDFVDAHIFKAPDQLDNWTKLQALIGKTMPDKLAWANEYRERHIRSYA